MSGGERLFSSGSDIDMPCYGEEYGQHAKCKGCLFAYWCKKLTPAPRLIFGMAAYNMAETLPLALISIEPYVDQLIVVEGRFKAEKGRPNPKYRDYPTPRSTDGTCELAHQYAHEVYDGSGFPQHTARDAYLRGRKGDYYFIFDADWVLHGKIDKQEILESKAVWLVEKRCSDGRHEQSVLLIFPHSDGIKHSVGQVPLIDGKGKLMDGTNYPTRVAKDFWIEHVNCLMDRKKRGGK